MNDTPEEIQKIQFNIINSKPLAERFGMMTEMTDFSIKLIENQSRRKNPSITKTQLKLDVFKALYQNDLDPQLLNSIMDDYKSFLLLAEKD